MRKIMRLAAVFAAVFAIAAAGCGEKREAVAEVVYTDETTAVIKALADGGSLEDAMNTLKDIGELDFTGDSGGYGLFIKSVNGRFADDKENEFWAIFTSLEEQGEMVYSDDENGTYNYDGHICGGALYGASGLPMAEGEYYVLSLEKYQ